MRQSTSDARSLSGETDSEQQAHADTHVRGDTDDSDTEHGRDGGGKDGLLLDENILQPYRVSTAKRNRDTPSYFSSCALKGSHISQKIVEGVLAASLGHVTAGRGFSVHGVRDEPHFGLFVGQARGD